MKPRLKYDPCIGMWMCGGLRRAPWYIDWYCAGTPSAAYNAWLKDQA